MWVCSVTSVGAAGGSAPLPFTFPTRHRHLLPAVAPSLAVATSSILLSPVTAIGPLLPLTSSTPGRRFFTIMAQTSRLRKYAKTCRKNKRSCSGASGEQHGLERRCRHCLRPIAYAHRLESYQGRVQVCVGTLRSRRGPKLIRSAARARFMSGVDERCAQLTGALRTASWTATSRVSDSKWAPRKWAPRPEEQSRNIFVYGIGKGEQYGVGS